MMTAWRRSNTRGSTVPRWPGRGPRGARSEEIRPGDSDPLRAAFGCDGDRLGRRRRPVAAWPRWPRRQRVPGRSPWSMPAIAAARADGTIWTRRCRAARNQRLPPGDGSIAGSVAAAPTKRWCRERFGPGAEVPRLRRGPAAACSPGPAAARFAADRRRRPRHGPFDPPGPRRDAPPVEPLLRAIRPGRDLRRHPAAGSLGWRSSGRRPSLSPARVAAPRVWTDWRLHAVSAALAARRAAPSEGYRAGAGCRRRPLLPVLPPCRAPGRRRRARRGLRDSPSDPPALADVRGFPVVRVVARCPRPRSA